jgi:hypothetical protein
MSCANADFYQAVLTAGAILTGFSGSFLQFRIQREANYYRFPAALIDREDADRDVGRDVLIDLTHFSPPFLLIILATSLALTFGFLFPLLGMGECASFVSPRLVTGGLVGALVFLAAYFLAELRHYRILRFLEDDKSQWLSQSPVIAGAVLLASAGWILIIRG